MGVQAAKAPKGKPWRKVLLAAVAVFAFDQGCRYLRQRSGPDQAVERYLGAHPAVLAVTGPEPRLITNVRQPLQAFGEGARYRFRVAVEGPQGGGHVELDAVRREGRWGVEKAQLFSLSKTVKLSQD